MITIHDLNTHINENTAVAIGKFDGFHVGHMAIIDKLLSYKQEGLKTCIVSFYPGPDAIFGKVDKKEIQSIEARREQIASFGIDYYVEVPFSEKLSRITKEDFLIDYLYKTINARAVVAGTDVSFGYKGQGDAAYLESQCPNLGIDLAIVEKIKINDEIVSSTLIEDKISKGFVDDAKCLLGSSYMISGPIFKGKQLGRKFGFPTVNIYVPDKACVPAFGVYATYTVIDNVKYKSLTNVGVNPTVENGSKIKIESYIYDFDEDVYGHIAQTFFEKHIRPERKFESTDELFAQIGKDKETVLSYLTKNC